MEEDKRSTDSGIEIRTTYDWDDVAGKDWDTDLGEPGGFPFTRGVYPTMYRGRKWTMRQYAGFASAEESNRRYRYLLDAGQTGLSVAFDLPTQMGYDSDHPLAEGEVGKVGVAVDSLADMEVLFAGIPLDQVSTSMTINAPASVLLILYELVAEKQGADTRELRGTIQNDILKEYVARGTYIFPPKPSMRIVTDIFKYCRENLPRWNTISISGYHIREAGSTAAQELAFTLSNGSAYVQAAVDAGLEVDEFAGQLSFFFNAHNNLLEEVAKYRAARRIWARLMRDQFGAKDDKSLKLRFHTQTAGSALTAQQPRNNIMRVTLQALELMGQVEEMGGAVSAIERGFTQHQIEESAYEYQMAIEAGEKPVVGVNMLATDDDSKMEILRVDPEVREKQSHRLEELREERNHGAVQLALAELREAVRGEDNLLYPMKEALRRYATLGEVVSVLRREMGEFKAGQAVRL